MQTELKIQKRKTKETEEIKDNLAKKLLLYRYDTDRFIQDSQDTYKALLC